jgi:SpoVK/Ycf46/Vps4 family AAA+-type ATPase
MAKKKKSKANSSGRSENGSHHRSPMGSTKSVGVNVSNMKNVSPKSMTFSVFHDANGQKRGRGIVEENERVINMHAEDALSMGVRDRDLVLLINVSSEKTIVSEQHHEESVQVVWDESSGFKQPRFTTVCRVFIQNPIGNNYKPGSPVGKGKKTLPKGRIQIWPHALSRRLNEAIIQEEMVCTSSPQHASMEHKISNMPPSTPQKSTLPKKTSTPASAKSGFSFEGFASSPSAPKINSARKESNSRKGHQREQVAVLPLHTNEALYTMLLGPAFTVELKTAPDPKPGGRNNLDSTAGWSKSTKVLEQMVLASCQGQCISVGDPIVISFQGKRIHFIIHKINENDQNMENSPKVKSLTTALHGLSLFNQNTIDSKPSTCSDHIANEILEQCRSELYPNILSKITHETKIKFISQDQDSTSEETSSITDSSSSDRLVERQDSQIGCIAGLESTILQVKKLLLPSLTHPELFARSGPIRAPKGVLLYGPSGCGKTLLADHIATDFKLAISSEHGGGIAIKTIKVNCANIQSASSIMGYAERQLTRIFDHAEQNATNQGISTLIVLDDVQLICPRRGMAGGGGGIDRVASTLLALIDGIGQVGSNEAIIHGKLGNVVILAITNNPSLLDPALRRAGRLDSEIEVPIPDDQTRSKIFSHLFKVLQKDNIAIPAFDEHDFMALARKAKGYTGADCVLCIKEATRKAIIRSRHQEKAIEQSSQHICINEEDLKCAMSLTKPSAIKSVTVEIPYVPWTAIGGMDSVKRQLREAIELPLTHAHIFESLKIPPPRGVLLYGPPGCSKTLMAKALATEGSMNFLAVKGPELLSKWLGESERALASLFRRARMASPCVIFFDEIDAIASKRGSGDSAGGGERLLSQLLTELDGVSRPGGATFSSKAQPRVVVVGATNRPDLLDTALTRPGRIDRKIYVGVPDLESRKGIFDIELRKKECDSDINVSVFINLFLPIVSITKI